MGPKDKYIMVATEQKAFTEIKIPKSAYPRVTVTRLFWWDYVNSITYLTTILEHTFFIKKRCISWHAMYKRIHHHLSKYCTCSGNDNIVSVYIDTII